MTYREMMERDHPKNCGDRFVGGCQGCPGDWYRGAPDEENDTCVFNMEPAADEETIQNGCRGCWDQEADK